MNRINVGQKTRTMLYIAWLSLVVLLVTPLNAQPPAQPIDLGTEITGEVSLANIAPAFSFTVDGAQTVNVQVRALTEGFAPAFRVLDANGLLVQDIGNPSNAPGIEALVQLTQPGSYIVQVQSANGAAGQFTLLVAAGETPPQTLNVDEAIDAEVGPETTERRYTFTADDNDALQLAVTSDEPSMAEVSLETIDEVEFADFSLMFTGASFNIPPNAGIFIVVVEYGESGLVEPYTIELRAPAEDVVEAPDDEPDTPPPPPIATNTPQPQFVLAPLPVSGPCIVASATGATVNVRDFPSESGDNAGQVITQITGNQTLNVTGRLPDTSWYRVDVSGTAGWIAEFVTRTGGECGNIPIVTAEGTAPPTATPPPVPGTPDLRVSGVTVTPDIPIEDQNFRVNATITNDGDGTASNVLVRLIPSSDDDINLSLPTPELTIATLDPGTSASISFENLNAADAGEVEFRVRVDPNNTIAESNEGNNDNTRDVDISESRADLVIDELDVDTEDGSTEVEITITALNTGSEESENFVVTLSFDPANVGQQTIDYDDLNPDERTTKTITVDLGAFDNYSVTARIDPDNTTDEVNEDNNSEARTFTVEE